MSKSWAKIVLGESVNTVCFAGLIIGARYSIAYLKLKGFNETNTNVCKLTKENENKLSDDGDLQKHKGMVCMSMRRLDLWKQHDLHAMCWLVHLVPEHN